MKVYLVKATFKDGAEAGVVYTNPDEALDAKNRCEVGSELPDEWADIYGAEDDAPVITMEEIEI